jgi:hypothetical protein
VARNSYVRTFLNDRAGPASQTNQEKEAVEVEPKKREKPEKPEQVEEVVVASQSSVAAPAVPASKANTAATSSVSTADVMQAQEDDKKPRKQNGSAAATAVATSKLNATATLSASSADEQNATAAGPYPRKKKRGAGGIRPYDKKRLDSFGPFPSAFSDAVHQTFAAWRQSEQPFYRIIPRNAIPTYDKDIHTRLQVGDEIEYENALGTIVRHHIFDFACDEIMFGPLAATSIKFTETRNACTKMTRIRNKKATPIPADTYLCWVRRNPNATHKLQQNWLQKRVSFHETLQVRKGSAEAAFEFNYATPTLMEIPGAGSPIDPKWRCIMNLPTSSPRSMVSGHTDLLYNTTQRPCFICGLDVEVHGDQPEWTEIDIDFYAYNKKKGKTYTRTILKSLVKHCEEHHPEQMFYFICKSPLDRMKNVPYSVKLHLQKALRTGSEVEERALGYDLFLTALRDNNPVPLQLQLSFIFGAVLNSLGPASGVRLMYDCKADEKKPSWLDHASTAFFAMARKNLKDVTDAIMNFDFRSLLPEEKEWPEICDGNDTDIYKIWNATNLWFRRGIFDDKPFPPIHYVAISELTLENFKPAAAPALPELDWLPPEGEELLESDPPSAFADL